LQRRIGTAAVCVGELYFTYQWLTCKPVGRRLTPGVIRRAFNVIGGKSTMKSGLRRGRVHGVVGRRRLLKRLIDI
jgi:hypothetical protein